MDMGIIAKNSGLMVLCFGLLWARGGYSSPLYPEDGSLGMNKWYVSKDALRITDKQYRAIEAAFVAEGVELVDFGFPYEYTQDIALFDQQGRFVYSNNNVPKGYLAGITNGVAQDYGAYIEVRSVEEKHIRKKAIPSGRKISLLLEGGGVITGINAKGENYIIIRGDRYRASLKYYRDFVDGLATEQEIVAYYAAELDIKPQNFIPLKSVFGSHLDTYMKALPNGLILLDDPSLALDVLQGLYESTGSERILKRIEAEKLYRKNTAYSNMLRNLNKVAKILSNDFQVVRVVGVFRDISYSKTLDGSYVNKTFREDTNFFNGVSAHNAGRPAFFITNKSPGSPELENYWSDFLVNFGFEAARVYFPGVYNPGNGLDCFGAPSL